MQPAQKNRSSEFALETNIETRLLEITERLEGLYPKSIDLSLERIERFLAEIGNPHLNLPPVIHIAGTNGKGSTLAYLRAILTSAKKSFHATISPHLISFNERVIINGSPIETSNLMELLDECDAVNSGAPITYFEIAIAATLLAFSRHKADYTLLETGLGGRLDATNVVPDPAVSVITTIGYDHMDYLGDNLKKIAYEKCGIFKQNCPCVVGPQTKQALLEGVMDVFISQAQQKNADLYLCGRDWFVEETPFGFRLMYGDKIEDYPMPSLLGRHQINNAATAIMAIRAIEDSQSQQIFSRDIIAQGIQNASWPGRLQKLEKTPLNALLPETHELFLDGGHNENAARALAKQFKRWKREDGRPLTLVLGMLNRKDPVEFVRPLIKYIDYICCVPVAEEKSSFKPLELKNLLQSAFPDLYIDDAPSPKIAIEKTALHQQQPSRSLIVGSLYLVGQILSEN